jgi:hypothetical protein
MVKAEILSLELMEWEHWWLKYYDGGVFFASSFKFSLRGKNL